MIEFLLARFSRFSLVLLIVAGLASLAGLGAWRAMAIVDRMVAAARDEANIARDAHWRAEIALSNAVVAEARLTQMAASQRLDSEATAEIARLKKTVNDLEARNAAIPENSNCGLASDRVRLLPR